MKANILPAALLAVLIAVTSCSDSTETMQQNPEVTQNTVSDSTEAEGGGRIPYDINGLDYGGYTFKIVSYDNESVNNWSGIPNDIFSESENGDLLNDTVYKRNLAVENALNIDITNEVLLDDQMTLRIEQTVLSGSNDVDAAFPRMYMIPQLVQKELLCDLLTLDTFDFSKPWYDQNAIDALTMYDKLFCVTSDITFTDKLSTYVTFFNQKMASDYDLGDLYSYVENGQ
ncbi:MAG: hypothetical protein ACI3XM_01810 [Eubacteriales bacterium]